MSPIEAHLVSRISGDLRRVGVAAEQIRVLSAEADNWRYRVDAAGRSFEIGFNLRERFWCREVTPGGERPFDSNDHPPIGSPDDAYRTAVALLGYALRHPAFAPRDPPVI